MRAKNITLFIILFLLFAMSNAYAAICNPENNASHRADSVGSGTEASPYIVNGVSTVTDTANEEALCQLQDIKEHNNAFYRLDTDINASATSQWNDGKGFLPINNFSGKFDGNGKTISSLVINNPSTAADTQGVFGSLNGGTLSKIRLIDISINSGGKNVGALVGQMTGGMIEEISVYSGHVTATDVVGGLVGEMSASTVLNSYARISVTATTLTATVGGLIGKALGDTRIINNYASGMVNATGNVGALIGHSASATTVINSYASGASRAVGIGNSGGAVRTLAQLQYPFAPDATYSGEIIYSGWDSNKWDFGGNVDLPNLLSHVGNLEVSRPIMVSLVIGESDIEVNWLEPAIKNNITVTVYGVNWDPKDSAGNGKAVIFNSNTNHRIDSLTKGTEYEIEVQSLIQPDGPMTIVGSVSKSILKLATTPTVVQNLVLTPGDTIVRVTWDVPTDDGGVMITGYVLIYEDTLTNETTSIQISATISATNYDYIITGLTNDRIYSVNVHAINEKGAGIKSSGNVTPSIILYKPSSVNVFTIEEGNKILTLVWEAPINDGGSEIISYAISLDGEEKIITPASSRTYTIAGLTNGQSYTAGISARNMIGMSDTATETATPSTNPGPVEMLTLTPGDTTMRVTWNPPSDNGGSEITRYLVSHENNGVTSSQLIAVSDYTILNLVNGNIYNITVIAMNKNGGSIAITATATPSNTSTVPDAVENLNLTLEGTTIYLTWDAPKNNGGSVITGYTINVDGGTPVSLDKTSTTYTVTGLTNGQSYTVSVSAVNTNGMSNARTATATPSTTPDAVENLSLTSGDMTIDVSWDAPANDGGSVITGYIINVDGGTPVSLDETSTTYTVTGLTNGQSYTVNVSAVNINGMSNARTATATPSTVPDAVENLSLTSGDMTIDVSWDAPADDGGSVITGYTINVDGGTPVSLDETSTIYTVTGLTNGQSYTVSVSAVNINGMSNARTATATPSTVPDAVENLSLTSGDMTIDVSWDTPADDGGSVITGYTINVDGGTPVSLDETSTTYTVTDLTNGQSYTVNVSAVNINGMSNARTATATPSTAPDAVENLSLTSGDMTIDVSWDTPADDGGSVITGYTINVDGGTPVSLDGTSTTYTVTGLTNGQSYTVSIRATNSKGNSVEETATATPSTQSTIPDSIENLSLTSGDATMSVTWNVPKNNGGSVITGYTINVDGGTPVSLDETSTTYTVTGLTNGQSYIVSVSAANINGMSNATTATATPSTVPDAVENLSLTSGDMTIDVSWDVPADDGGSVITGYTINIDGSTPVSLDETSTTYTLTGLTNGQSYTVSVSAVNINGDGPTETRDTILAVFRLIMKIKVFLEGSR